MSVRAMTTSHQVSDCMEGEDCPVCRHYLRRVPLTSVVYYLRRSSDRAVKIGYTTRLATRMSELGGIDPVGVPDAFWLIAVHLGGPLHERLLHERFADERIGPSEWFRSSERLEAHIDRVAEAEGVALGGQWR